jgi:DNA polymerase V
MLTVFLSTNYFNKREPQYGNSKTVSIPIGTNLTPVLLKYALHCLTGIYRAGFKYKRVGIMLSGFVPEESKQSILFESNVNPKIKILQDSIDSINKRFVRDQVRFASEGFERRWTMKREWLSPRYTTQIDEILVVRV